MNCFMLNEMENGKGFMNCFMLNEMGVVCFVISISYLLYEPHRGKTNNVVSELV